MITYSLEQPHGDVHVSTAWLLLADMRASCLLETVANVGAQAPGSDRPLGLVTLLCGILTLLAVISSLIGLLVTEGRGRAACRHNGSGRIGDHLWQRNLCRRQLADRNG